MSRSYSVYGVILRSDYPFANRLPGSRGAPDLSFSCVDGPAEAGERDAFPPVMESRYRLETGESVLALHRRNGREVLRFTGVADFHLRPDRIDCRLLDPAYGHVVEILFLGVVLAYWLERRGVLMLHASAVVVDGRAVAFLATRQGGKTSLAAAMIERGCPLLTDDLMPVRMVDGNAIAYPGYPQMRFWPADAERVLGHFEDLPLVHPDFTKRRAPVGEGGVGTFCPLAVPLGRVYLPERIAPGAGPVEIAPASGSEALMALVRHSFTPNLVQAAGLQPERLRVMGELARRVPVRRLRYPGGFERLEELSAAIRKDATGEPETSGHAARTLDRGDRGPVRSVLRQGAAWKTGKQPV